MSTALLADDEMSRLVALWQRDLSSVRRLAAKTLEAYSRDVGQFFAFMGVHAGGPVSIAMLTELRSAGIPAEISQTAGTYVCNHVFYGLMHALHSRPGVRGGFIHIPYSPEQAARHPGAPSLPVETIVAALRIALDTALATRHDRRIAAGAEH